MTTEPQELLTATILRIYTKVVVVIETAARKYDPATKYKNKSTRTKWSNKQKPSTLNSLSFQSNLGYKQNKTGLPRLQIGIRV